MTNRYHARIQQGDTLYAEQYLMQGGNYQFCWHRSMELMVILKGSAEVFADGKQYLLEQDDMLLINPNCGHSTFLHDLDSVLLIMEITPEFFDILGEKGSSALAITCASDAQTRYSPLFARLRFFIARIFQLALGATELEQRLARQYLSVLMSELMLHFPTQLSRQHGREGKEKEALQRAMEYIETNFDRKLTLEQVAAHAQYNRTYLSTLFKKCTGILFNDYIIRVRLRHTLEVLADPNKSIMEIALDHGFPDSKSFSASMKKYCGRTPQEYRQALRNNPELHIQGGKEKLLPRPDAAMEQLLQGYIIGLSGMERVQPASKGRELEECCDEMSKLLDKMRGFI